VVGTSQVRAVLLVVNQQSAQDLDATIDQVAVPCSFMMQSLSTIKELYKGEGPAVILVITVLVLVELAFTPV
jgi:hypothetical protein